MGKTLPLCYTGSWKETGGTLESSERSPEAGNAAPTHRQVCSLSVTGNGGGVYVFNRLEFNVPAGQDGRETKLNVAKT